MPVRPVGLTAVSASVALVFSLPAAGAAQRGEDAPWYGLAVPTGLELPPPLSVVNDAGFAAPPSPVPSGEGGYAELHGPQ